MKKFKFFFLLLCLLFATPVFAHYCPYRYYVSPYYPLYYRPVVPISTYTNTYQEFFPGCDKHILKVNELVTEYSNRTSSSYRWYSVVDKNGFVIFANADYIEHLDKDGKHYFLVKANGKTKIIDDRGGMTSAQEYVSAVPIAYDRIKVSKNVSLVKTHLGVIDYSGKEIIPLKYQQIDAGSFNNGLYITKLNGYFGLINLDNHSLLRNEYDEIKEFLYVYKLKKEGKYGLADMSGNLVLEANYDKIDVLGDYIIVKNKNNLWAAYDSYGRILAPFRYKKIKLERNTLVGINGKNREILAK